MSEIHVCDVCRVINNDITPKESVWCNRCKAWICIPDINRWDRRGIAMYKLWGNKQGPTVEQRRKVGVIPSTENAPVSGGCGGCEKENR